MADVDYRRLAAACHCGQPVKVNLSGRGRPAKYCKTEHKPRLKQSMPEKCGCGARLRTGADGAKPTRCKKCLHPPPQQKDDKQCPACRGFFTPRLDGQTHCSRVCRVKARCEAKRKKEPKGLMACAACSKPFVQTVPGAMYCSKLCKQTEWHRRNPGRRRQYAAPKLCVYVAKHCSGCGKAEGFRRPWDFCASCRDERRKERGRQAGRLAAEALHRAAARVTTCVECAVDFCPLYGVSQATLCSPCVVVRTKKHRRVHKAKRRAIERGAEAESIDPLQVFARDKWRCQLCGTKTPKELRGGYEDSAPELDRIVPLSKGGTHTHANVQCACRRCNGDKSDKPMGQTLLFG